jgi:hypothetical protein
LFARKKYEHADWLGAFARAGFRRNFEIRRMSAGGGATKDPLYSSAPAKRSVARQNFPSKLKPKAFVCLR